MPSPSPSPSPSSPFSPETDTEAEIEAGAAAAATTISDARVDSLIVADDTLRYWNSVSADVNGMLGGYPQVSRIDLQGSKNFIAKIRRASARQSQSQSQSSQQKSRLPRAVDCGAGIGRITTGLLTRLCSVVDVVEPVDKFAQVLVQRKASLYGGDHHHNDNDGDNDSVTPTTSEQKGKKTKKDQDQEEEEGEEGGEEGRIGDIYVQGLESWRPRKEYDLIWNQWCVGHLTDAQLVDYLRRAGQALTATGWVVVKENLSNSSNSSISTNGISEGEGDDEDLFDDVDSSVTRSDRNFHRLFDQAGMKVVREELQTGFPKSLGLYPVKMYALRPK